MSTNTTLKYDFLVIYCFAFALIIVSKACPNEYVPKCVPCEPEETCDSATKSHLDVSASSCITVCACTKNNKSYCKQGFFRDNNGNCVKHKDCPSPDPDKQTCGPHEVSTACGPCPPEQTCRDLINGTPPPHICRLVCGTTPSCSCEDGFFRNGSGSCVAPEECLSKKPCTKMCFKGYVCINNNCVPDPSNNTDCGPNEVSAACGPCLSEQTCLDAFRSTPLRIECSQICHKPFGCYCKDGFYRNGNGNCVLSEDCGGCSFDCKDGFICKNETCIPSCALIKCKSGTSCKDGECIPIIPTKTCRKKCRNGSFCLNGRCVPKLRPNEDIPVCSPCEPDKTCNAVLHPSNGKPKECTDICTKNTKAYCIIGFYRLNSKCVHESECILGPNEAIPSCKPCLDTCEDFLKSCPHVKCNKKCENNSNGKVFCVNGFYRLKGKCVSVERCLKAGKRRDTRC